MAIREGKWKCTSCATVNLGRNTQCSACGKVRGADVEFFVDDSEAETTDETLLQKAAGGADWHCEWCGSDNQAAQSACRQCSAQRGTAPSRQQKIILDKNGQTPATGNTGSTPPAAAKKATLPGLLVIAGILAVVVGLVWFLFFKTDVVPVTVSSAGWERAQDVEEERLVRETAWENNVPSGARVLRSWQEKFGTEDIQVGTERVKTGKKDLGNGFFEDVYENRPVYETRDVFKNKVEYEIWKWIVIRTEKMTGTSDMTPQWPQVSLDYRQRLGGKREKAEVNLINDKDSGKNYVYSVPVQEISAYSKGQKLTAEITVTGIVHTLKP